MVLDVAGSSPVVRPNFIAGLILAGGQARRLGGIDKPLLQLGETTLLGMVSDRLAPQVDHLALSANGDPSRFAAFGLEVLADDKPDLGPLAGVLAGLRWARTQSCTALLTVPGDTPFIPGDLLARLAPAPAAASSGGRLHPTVALWPVACLEALEAHLRTGGSRSVQAFARTLPARIVEFAIDGIDPFFNINTPDDLARARALQPVPPPG